MDGTWRSERLLYRALETSTDDQFLFSTYRNPEVFINAVNLLPCPWSAEETAEARKSMITGLCCGLKGKATGDDQERKTLAPTPVGFLSLRNPPLAHLTHHRSTVMGIVIAKEHHGSGYGPEAIKSGLNWGFRMAGLHRVGLQSRKAEKATTALYSGKPDTKKGRKGRKSDKNKGDTVKYGHCKKDSYNNNSYWAKHPELRPSRGKNQKKKNDDKDDTLALSVMALLTKSGLDRHSWCFDNGSEIPSRTGLPDQIDQEEPSQGYKEVPQGSQDYPPLDLSNQQITRSYTQGNLALFATALLAIQVSGYIAAVTDYEEPKTLQEAKDSPDWPEWLEAIYTELRSLIKNNTWRAISVSNGHLKAQGKKPLDAKWVFKIKYGADNQIIQYKAY
ncbi:hypothetical protein OIDMADRAFT_181702 [Oidiodendron maius Zn]|uniref:N-acetyltransferase domain-containing protein n=1 Tax=Oidiodendron maius (strain Zn) TaxID=913774 RepID=A0A0C3CGW2_OIDMZ|nr:hypothetical protein OIDMADRAFT_181702 [Oidiodendron maius Zn]